MGGGVFFKMSAKGQMVSLARESYGEGRGKKMIKIAGLPGFFLHIPLSGSAPRTAGEYQKN